MGERLAGLRVLVVDDVAEFRYLMHRWLTRQGADVAVAAGAREAIELAASVRPRVAVVDIFMPGRGGLFVLNRLRSLRVRLELEMSIVAITSHAGEEVRDIALRAGFDAFVPRPTTPEPLVETLRLIAAPATHRYGVSPEAS